MPSGSRPRLFERLETAQSGSRRRSYALRTDDVFESIQAHLMEIFSVRQGTVEARPDYGLPDFSGRFSTDEKQMRKVTREIEYVIEQFEPRLHSPEVTYLGTEHEVFAFRVTGQVAIDEGLQTIQLRTVMDRDNLVSVRTDR
ncbi:MAG: type VI secretion system baseplate subunit TssE [Pseudomonadota bacterium]